MSSGLSGVILKPLIRSLSNQVVGLKTSGGLVLLDVFEPLDEVFVDAHLAAVGVHGDVDDLGLGDLEALARAAVALGLDDDADGDGGGADAQRLRVEADEVADEDGLVEDDLAHGDGDEALDAGAAVRLDRPGDVDVTEDDAAEDGALRVRVARQQRDADGGIAV